MKLIILFNSRANLRGNVGMLPREACIFVLENTLE